jgi:hypothetical protein
MRRVSRESEALTRAAGATYAPVEAPILQGYVLASGVWALATEAIMNATTTTQSVVCAFAAK